MLFNVNKSTNKAPIYKKGGQINMLSNDLIKVFPLALMPEIITEKQGRCYSSRSYENLRKSNKIAERIKNKTLYVFTSNDPIFSNKNQKKLVKKPVGYVTKWNDNYTIQVSLTDDPDLRNLIVSEYSDDLVLEMTTKGSNITRISYINEHGSDDYIFNNGIAYDIEDIFYFYLVDKYTLTHSEALNFYADRQIGVPCVSYNAMSGNTNHHSIFLKNVN
jgi:hypothetical protein